MDDWDIASNCLVLDTKEPIFMSETFVDADNLEDIQGEVYQFCKEEVNRFDDMPNLSPDSSATIKNCYLSTGILPSYVDYPGDFNFSVILDENPAKKKWVYSIRLNKLFTIWNTVIPVQLKWISNESNLVRALPVYTDAQNLKNPVFRCILHSSPADSTNDGFEYVNHIIRSDNDGAVYDENPESKRCSVVVPLGEPQPGTSSVTVTYKFMCKTTCLTGMMRRPIAVLFTLERPCGEVIGRQKINVKICSCPARDMGKEEDHLDEKNRAGNRLKRAGAIDNARAKKLKMGDNIHNQILVVQFEDQAIFRKIMEFNHAAASTLLRTTPRSDTSFAALQSFLQEVENKM